MGEWEDGALVSRAMPDATCRYGLLRSLPIIEGQTSRWGFFDREDFERLSRYLPYGIQGCMSFAISADGER